MNSCSRQSLAVSYNIHKSFSLSLSHCDTRLLLSSKMSFKKSPLKIVVEGNIGSGKTHLLKHLQTQHSTDFDVDFEPIEAWSTMKGGNLLNKMYEKPEKYAALFQQTVLLSQLKNIRKHSNKPVKLIERSMYSGKYLFVPLLKHLKRITLIECTVLDEWFDYLTTLPDTSVDLIVYVKCSPKTAYSSYKAVIMTSQD